jgi:hypothetical protein
MFTYNSFLLFEKLHEGRIMEEYFAKSFVKEEEFLGEFGETARIASDVLNGEWTPNYYSSDYARENLKYFFSTGDVDQLVFDSAAIYRSNNVFSSVQILLKSSHRTVNVRVKQMDNELVGEKIVDRVEENKIL